MGDAANDNAGSTPSPKRRCPICGRAASAADRPFCSARCADIDLHRWLGEGYRVPAEFDDDMGNFPDATPE